METAKFDKDLFLEKAKEILKKESKQDAKEFLEENSKTVWEVVKLYAELTPNLIDNMVVATLDKMVLDLIEGINKEDNA